MIRMLKALTVDITSRCEYSCLHCHSKKQKNKSEISLEELQKLFKMAKKAGVSDIFLSGGEPFLYPWLKEALEYSLEQRLFLSIFTSCPSNFEKQIKTVAGYPNISQIRVSVESAEPELLKFIRKNNNAYRHLIKGIEILKELNLFYGISTTVSELNLFYLEDTFQFAIEHKAGFFRLSPIVNPGKPLDNYLFAKKALNEFSKILLKHISFIRSSVFPLFEDFSSPAWMFDLRCPAFSHTGYVFKKNGEIALSPCPYVKDISVKLDEKDDLGVAFEKLLVKMKKENPKETCFVAKNYSDESILLSLYKELASKLNRQDEKRAPFLLAIITNRQAEIYNFGFYPCWRSSPLFLYPLQHSN